MVEFKLKPGAQVYCYNDGTWYQAGPSAAGLVLRGKQAASTIEGLPPDTELIEFRSRPFKYAVTVDDVEVIREPTGSGNLP
jgi:hypothetical protein